MATQDIPLDPTILTKPDLVHFASRLSAPDNWGSENDGIRSLYRSTLEGWGLHADSAFRQGKQVTLKQKADADAKAERERQRAAAEIERKRRKEADRKAAEAAEEELRLQREQEAGTQDAMVFE